MTEKDLRLTTRINYSYGREVMHIPLHASKKLVALSSFECTRLREHQLKCDWMRAVFCFLCLFALCDE